MTAIDSVRRAARAYTSKVRFVKSRRGFILAACVALATFIPALSTGPALGGGLEKPKGKTILRIIGNIANTNSDGVAEFDREMLKAFPMETIKTVTPWTDGVMVFEGPLASEVLKAVGAQGGQVKAVALDDYAVAIPISDFSEHGVILAMTMNGERLQTGTKGPLWVIYPWSDKAELQNDVIHGRSIWQLKEMGIEK